mmetsp:Transcript_108750/g.294876  ORF Transcript_108750/g.294876 Transcript_108750/m.294876 type:complete len:500 (-) Transcript_108750:316-1815(-)
MKVVFACSAHVGHLNPTLPVVKALVSLGHEVHYICFETMRAKIESAGAKFHSCEDIQPELYARRSLAPGGIGACNAIMGELGLDTSSVLSMLMTLNLSLEKELPGTLRFFKDIRPDVVVYDPLVFCRYAAHGAAVMGIPAVGLLTLAGPGAMRLHTPAVLHPLTIADIDYAVREFTPHAEATARINDKHSMQLRPGILFPDGYMDSCRGNTIIVTTSEDLQDPMTPELSAAYTQDGARFEYVGPLLALASQEILQDKHAGNLLMRVRRAREAGRQVVMSSMGTLVTSNHSINGWDARSGSSSITGKQLCQAVWAGTFEAIGSEAADSGPLIVVALGSQADPLGDIAVPANAVCVPFFQQVDILHAGADLFLTHGGQNSFTEAMFFGTPVVVCPGFGDQVVNAQKAVDLGVGVKVDRPMGNADTDGVATRSYRQEVCNAVTTVLSQLEFKEAAMTQGHRLRDAGGVPRAVDLVLAAAADAKREQSESIEDNTAVAGRGGA